MKLLSIAALSIVLNSCGIKPSSYQVESNSESINFEELCKNWDLENCISDVQKDKLTQEQWSAAVDLIEIFNQGSTSISIDETTYKSQSAQNLIKEVVGENILRQLNSFSLTNITLGQGNISIEAKHENNIQKNKLNLQASSLLEISMAEKGIIDISGLHASSASEPAGFEAKRLDLNTYGEIQVQSDETNINHLQWDFLLPNLDNHTIQPVGFINSLTANLFSNDFQWRDVINVHIPREDAIAMVEKLIILAPYEGVKSTLGNTAEKVESVNFGIDEGEVASIKLNSGVTCHGKAHGLPFIGSANLTLNFSNHYGLGREQKTWNGVKFDVFGVSTSFGNVEHAEIEGNTLKVKVGWFTIPLNLEQDISQSLEITNCY